MTLSKKKIWIGIAAVIVIAAAVCGWYFGIKVPHDNAFNAYSETVTAYNTGIEPYNAAVSDYNAVVQEVSAANDDLDSYISNAQDDVNSGSDPYDPETLNELSAAISEAREEQIPVPEEESAISQISVTDEDRDLSRSDLEAKTSSLEGELSELERGQTALEEKTDALAVPDYSAVIQNLTEKQSAYEDSVKILAQITCPEESFVISRLQEIEDVQEIGAVTEDNDPNGKLNKAGGYTSTVYFSLSQVNQADVYGTDLIDKGTAAGGAIETYSCVEDAESRNTYLSAFDGSILSNGAHMVLGTMVIRVSDELAASQQKEMQEKLIAVLTALK